VAEYKVTVSGPASKALGQLPASVVARIFPKVEELAATLTLMVRKSCKGSFRFGAFASAITA